MRDLLTLDALTADELLGLLDDADALKSARWRRADLGGRAVGLLFDEASLRHRVTFEVAVVELGGHPVVLDGVAALLDGPAGCVRELAAPCGALVLGVHDHGRLEQVAATAHTTVVNAVSDFAHPCQVVADLQTIREYKGSLDGLKLAYLGDGNNLANSLLCGGAMAGMHVAVGSPPGYEPIPQVVEVAAKLAAESGGSVEVTANPLEAARDAAVVYTDTWRPGSSAGEQGGARSLILRPFQVGYHVMEAASPDAIVLHGRPSNPGDEIAAELVADGQRVVWTQVDNRLHAAKALLRLCLRERGAC